MGTVDCFTQAGSIRERRGLVTIMADLYPKSAIAKLCTPVPTMTNFAGRTIWAGDILDVLQGLDSVSVDLIWLEPGFDCERDCGAAVGRAGAGAAFKDTWRCRIWTWHGWG